MKLVKFVVTIIIILVLVGCSSENKLHVGPKPGEKWRAVHLINYENDKDLQSLGENIPRLAEMGINVLILEVDYNFNFNSHPELRRGETPITKKEARKLVKLSRKYGIRLIPEFQSLGHQSWEGETFPLLIKYPQFDLTPGAFPENKGIYCREWDLLNSELNPIIFSLMDEIIDAFAAEAFHVGMDEVFLLGSEYSPSTRGKDPAKLYAKAVNDIYDHLVTKRGMQMLMWGDRLIDGEKYEFGEWEAAKNGTAAAIDSIPKDIIICPWHYELKDSYPSIPMFIEKGFRVLPVSWRNIDATKALIQYSQKQKSPKMLGHLFTTWSVTKEELTEFPPMVEGLKLMLD